MSIFSDLFGGGTQTVKQTYQPSPQELGWLTELMKYYRGGQGFVEGRRFLSPEITGIQHYTRDVGTSYGGGAEIAADLKGKSIIGDLIAKYGIQRQGEVGSQIGGLVKGTGTQVQTTQAPIDLGWLGELLGYYLQPKLMGAQKMAG